MEIIIDMPTPELKKAVEDKIQEIKITTPTHEEAIEALREASISIASLIDENCDDLILGLELEHIQDQITILENFYDPVINNE